MITTPNTYKANIPLDDGKPINFRFHFPRGTLQERMTGYELGLFILKHMQGMLAQGLLTGRAKTEFEAMFLMLATNPKAATHKLFPWIRSVTKTEHDDIIQLSLYDRTPIKKKTLISI